MGPSSGSSRTGDLVRLLRAEAEGRGLLLPPATPNDPEAIWGALLAAEQKQQDRPRSVRRRWRRRKEEVCPRIDCPIIAMIGLLRRASKRNDASRGSRLAVAPRTMIPGHCLGTTSATRSRLILRSTFACSPSDHALRYGHASQRAPRAPSLPRRSRRGGERTSARGLLPTPGMGIGVVAEVPETVHNSALDVRHWRIVHRHTVRVALGAPSGGSSAQPSAAVSPRALDLFTGKGWSSTWRFQPQTTAVVRDALRKPRRRLSRCSFNLAILLRSLRSAVTLSRTPIS